jgi:uncharacterized membrane protein (UPF0127 family)
MLIRRCVLLLALLLLPVMAVAGQAFDRMKVEVVTGGGRHAFAIELARTPEQLAQGLMFRPKLAEDAGMLFDFGRVQTVAMWMKNTLIPLDMLFLAADGRIVHIAEYAVPGSLEPLGPRESVRAVLELNAGTSRRLGIHTGDQVIHSLFTAAR